MCSCASCTSTESKPTKPSTTRANRCARDWYASVLCQTLLQICNVFYHLMPFVAWEPHLVPLITVLLFSKLNDMFFWILWSRFFLTDNWNKWFAGWSNPYFGHKSTGWLFNHSFENSVNYTGANWTGSDFFQPNYSTINLENSGHCLVANCTWANCLWTSQYSLMVLVQNNTSRVGRITPCVVRTGICKDALFPPKTIHIVQDWSFWSNIQ